MNRLPTSDSSPELLAPPEVSAVGGARESWLNAPTLPHVETNTSVTLPTIPGFELMQELGRGGMGVVYKAFDRRTSHVVAIKVLIAGSHAGVLERERFRREMTSAAALQHPNVVQLLNAGEHHGLPYLVLEYIDGGTLADRLTGTPWAPTAAVKLVSHLAKAVQFAHDRGIIHRDLKPANILFANDVPKLTDFGLSKSLDLAVGGPATETGAVLGTPSYISPEQATGDKDVGPASDVYSLGAILYELLTGRPPFDGKTTLDIVLKVLNESPVAPTRFSPELPNDLEAIVLKCLHKNPAKRYTSAGDLLADLQRFLVGESVVARPPSVARRVFTWFSRRPRLTTATATAAVMLLMILGGVGYAVAAIREASERAEKAAASAEANRLEIERVKAEIETTRRVADQERRRATEMHAKYEQLRNFFESFRPGKIAQIIEPKAEPKAISADPPPMPAPRFLAP